MGASTTAREALIAEAIGDVTLLLDRLDALGPTLDEVRQGLAQAAGGLDARLAAFETRMAALTEHAKVRAVDHIVRRTDQVARQALEAQTRAMEEAARAALHKELDPALQRLALPLRQLVQRVNRPWEQWLTHAATAVAASAATWLMAAWLWAS